MSASDIAKSIRKSSVNIWHKRVYKFKATHIALGHFKSARHTICQKTYYNSLFELGKRFAY
jgi:hypothetical protein